jgi:hypothetical protein
MNYLAKYINFYTMEVTSARIKLGSALLKSQVPISQKGSHSDQIIMNTIIHGSRSG